MTNTVDLASLTGEHMLDAVDRSSKRVQMYGDHFEDASILLFRLDGVVYAALEDPSDGYRSAMERLFVSDEPMSNVFPPIKVEGRKRPPENGYEQDVLELYDAETKLLVLAVGTRDVDDYYPAFVDEFNPQNMVTNAERVDR